MWQGVWGLIFEVQCGQKARGTSMVHQQGAEDQPENGNAVCLGKGQNRGTADAGWAEPPEALCSLDALGMWSAFASASAVPSDAFSADGPGLSISVYTHHCQAPGVSHKAFHNLQSHVPGHVWELQL